MTAEPRTLDPHDTILKILQRDLTFSLNVKEFWQVFWQVSLVQHFEETPKIRRLNVKLA